MEHDGVWSLDRAGGLEKAWCCLAATARDLAKFGRLYLERGVWAGERLLSEAWIQRSVGRGGVDDAAVVHGVDDPLVRPAAAPR